MPRKNEDQNERFEFFLFTYSDCTSFGPVGELTKYFLPQVTKLCAIFLRDILFRLEKKCFYIIET